MQIKDFLKDNTHQLPNSSSPRLDLEVLMAAALNKDRNFVLLNTDYILNESEIILIEKYLARRKKSEPVAYIVGSKEFYGYDFIVNSDVLIPRPDTELIVELAFQNIKSTNKPLKILELGTGSGCIAITLAKLCADKKIALEITAIDRSSTAIKIAKQNATKHEVNEVIIFKESDWFSSIEGDFDLIISNPPYVNPQLELKPDLNFEPADALYAKEQGLEDVFYLIDEAIKHLREDGIFLCEIGAEQKAALIKYYEQKQLNYRNINFYQDLAGNDRVLELKS